jgi:hypothetical protein
MAVALGAAMAIPSVAHAQTNPNCPPGSWFCADTQEKPAAPAGQPVAPPATAAPKTAEPLQPLPPQGGAAAGQAPAVVYQPAPQPPVVIYQPAPPVVVRDAPPPYVYTPREPLARRHEWGLHTHLEGAMLGSRAHESSGMGGIGFGVRFKPVPSFGVEADVDFIGGRDYNGFRRAETAFTLNALIFVNPKSKTQLYFLGGFGWSAARVDTDNNHMYATDDTYRYFGGQAGVGLEFRITKHFAMNVDLRGFIRGRTDEASQYRPEFTDPATGRTTNTSGGGLLTGGMTFYF